MGKKGKTDTQSKSDKTSEGQDSKDAQNLQVPDLDQLITQITNNGDFKEMMSSISGGLTQDHQKILDATEVDTESDQQSHSSVHETAPVVETHGEGVVDSNYDMMCSLFTDNDGNNICELLGSINQNLAEINSHFRSLVEATQTPST